MVWLNYDDIDNALRQAESQYSASGCQGVACGMLVVDNASSASAWIGEMIEDADSADLPGIETRQILNRFFDTTREQLGNAEMSFTLLLPQDEQVSLHQRVEEVTRWCEGFLCGMAIAGLTDDNTLEQDSAEILSDIVEISKAWVGEDRDEENEAAYSELVEYLRVGALLLREELQRLQDG
ncbi:MAG: UPF0149 family protein [Gammaproteobacteria bacterium]|nr:UPF0149 family protein [Gammaproteobacteria bacterium]